MKSVEVKNLTKRFGDFTAVKGITFEVKKGEIFGFLGPNGAGKSTTIRMLCGILAPTDGEGHVLGHNVLTEQDKIKRSIGYMSQKFSLYDDLTIKENLEFFGSIYGLEGTKLNERIEYALSIADIDTKVNSLVGTLPLGIKQRLSLGASLLHDPEILFLDEPTSGVDPNARRNFWELIYKFSERGKTIFVTTHYLEEAEHCDRIALIIAGTVIALDTPSNLKSGLPYSIYSLKADNFIKLFDQLNSLTAIKEKAIFGSDIHIMCEVGKKPEQEIKDYLKKIGVNKYKLEIVPATLEDVFVTMARKYGV